MTIPRVKKRKRCPHNLLRMAVVKPFKAIRPTRDKVVHVASKSYEAYDPVERDAILTYNPFSFLHIINPGYKFHQDVGGKERFRLVHNRYLEFLEDQIFIQEETPSFYLYQIEDQGHKSLGFFCATSVKDYENGIIKKHEDTLEDREVLFADYLNTVGFNAEPVLMAYKDDKRLAAIWARKIKEQPLYDFTTTDRAKHQIWRIDAPKIVTEIENIFSEMPSLYIADGHHRSASSYLLSEERKSNNPNHMGTEAYNYFMSYLIPESEIRIYEYNRLIRGLNGLSKEEFLIQLDTFYRIEEKKDDPYNPSQKHHFSMYLDGQYYSLYLRKKVYDMDDSLSALDTQILFKTILEPILGIQDLRNDKRIAYRHGKYNILKMKDAIDQGEFTVGFGLLPLTIEEIMAVADADLVMPPKSTYIEPKLRSGLAIYEL